MTKQKYVVIKTPKGDRQIISENFNMRFRKSDGMTMKWGKEFEDDPTHCPFGNEIADIEITTVCRGIRNAEGKRRPCTFCYKLNSPSGLHMSLDTFKQVFDNLNKAKTMTQIAFGVDAEGIANPETWDIFDYAIENNVTPNVTVADITPETADELAKRCGAVAVSAYQTNKNACYDTVKLLTEARKRYDRPMAVNIHILLSKETLPFIDEVLEDIKTDERLSELFAVVFLALKQKGGGKSYTQVTTSEFTQLMTKLLEDNVVFGMDSCSATTFLDVLESREEWHKLKTLVEPCEAFCFSTYVNAEGQMFPCSFIEGEKGWEEGIDLTVPVDFQKIWGKNSRVLDWRNAAVKCIEENGCNECPVFEIVKEN